MNIGLYARVSTFDQQRGASSSFACPGTEGRLCGQRHRAGAFHRGEIGVESALGRGSTLHFTLPVYEE